MLRYIVLFRRHDGMASQPALESALIERLTALGPQIPALTGWRVAASERDRPLRWDYVLEAEAADAAALDAYLYDPLHLALVADLAPYFEWATVEYTV